MGLQLQAAVAQWPEACACPAAGGRGRQRQPLPCWPGTKPGTGMESHQRARALRQALPGKPWDKSASLLHSPAAVMWAGCFRWVSELWGRAALGGWGSPMLRNPAGLQPPHQVPTEGPNGGAVRQQLWLCQAGRRSGSASRGGGSFTPATLSVVLLRAVRGSWTEKENPHA